MKSPSEMLRVDATSPPTFTCAPWPNRMPLGFTRNTLPLADRLPMMLEGSAPSTRLSATALLVGCTNCTASVLPMLKLCQLIATLGVDWLTVTLPGVVVIFALPADTAPSVGRAQAFEPRASMREAASPVRAKRARTAVGVAPSEDLLDSVPRFSEAATTVLVLSCHIDR